MARYNGDQSLDTTPPDTTITAGPVSLSADTTPTFEFSADGAGSSFECAIDGDVFGSCTSPHTTVPLPDGPHTFAVRATDTAGNTDPTPAAQAFTIDTTPPETAITFGPDSPTADTTPTFEFSADKTDATFACQLDGGLFAPCDSPHTTAELAGGSHAFALPATDLAGNRDPSPATMRFRVCTGPLSGLAIELDRLQRVQLAEQPFAALPISAHQGATDAGVRFANSLHVALG